MRGLRGLFILAIFGAAFAQNPELPRCREGVAQPSARVLVTKLSRAFEEQDATAKANLAGCPFLVGKYETDNVSYVPPLVFAKRFFHEVKKFDLTLREGDVSSVYPKKPRRIFLKVDGEQAYAELYVDRKPKEFGSHRHIFLLERNSDGWRFRGYGTTDGVLLERLRRGYTAVLVQAAK